MPLDGEPTHVMCDPTGARSARCQLEIDMKPIRLVAGFVAASLIGLFSALPFSATQAQTPETPKVVYHFDDATTQALKGLRSIRNQLDTAPTTKLAIVALADGVDMFLEDAKDTPSGIAFAPLIADLKARGVEIYLCELTLRGRNLAKDAFILEADYTISGVVKLTSLQQEDGYAYIKP
jgi:intracellular sulfur oxidation DsrE/DsrF family protein